MVARLCARDAGADRLDNAGAFVPEDHGRGKVAFAGDDVPVAVADACRRHFHQHFARFGRRYIDCFDFERGLGFG